MAISSAQGTTTAVFLLGMVGGCMLSGAGDLYQDQQSQTVARGQQVQVDRPPLAYRPGPPVPVRQVGQRRHV